MIKWLIKKWFEVYNDLIEVWYTSTKALGPTHAPSSFPNFHATFNFHALLTPPTHQVLLRNWIHCLHRWPHQPTHPTKIKPLTYIQPHLIYWSYRFAQRKNILDYHLSICSFIFSSSGIFTSICNIIIVWILLKCTFLGSFLMLINY